MDAINRRADVCAAAAGTGAIVAVSVGSSVRSVTRTQAVSDVTSAIGARTVDETALMGVWTAVIRLTAHVTSAKVANTATSVTEIVVSTARIAAGHKAVQNVTMVTTIHTATRHARKAARKELAIGRQTSALMAAWMDTTVRTAASCVHLIASKVAVNAMMDLVSTAA